MTRPARRFLVVRGFFVGGVLAVAAMACRGEGPSGDPKIPVNSPIPEVDRREEPTPAIQNPFVDGGAR